MMACPAGPGAEGPESSSEEAETGGPQLWLEFADGCISDPYAALSDGDEITMVLGGQGLLMFPLHLRVGDFDLPPDFGATSPETPRLHLNMFVDGHAYGPADTFARIANYPMLVQASDEGEGVWELRYLTVFVPDEISGIAGMDPPQIVDGLEAEIEWRLEVEGYADLEGSLSVVMSVPDPFEPVPSCDTFGDAG